MKYFNFIGNLKYPKDCILPSLRVFAKAESQAVGTKYAQALLDIAQSKGDLDAVHSDVEILNELINKSTELRDIMTNPLVTNEKKKDLIKQISTNGKFNTFTSNFLDLLVDKGRIDCILEVLRRSKFYTVRPQT